jgi:DNA-binding transcriptional ArsR family regulator
MHNALQRHYGIDEKEALTASELAALAGISRSTASGHLGKLAAAQLVAVTQKRRNRYYRIASPLVARMLESNQGGGGAGDAGALSAALSAGRRAALRALLLRSPRRPAWRRARRCAGGEEIRRAERGGWCAHRARAKVSLRLRRRSHREIRQPAHLLPRLPRLERAAPPHRRAGRGGNPDAPRRVKLARPRTRQPRVAPGPPDNAVCARCLGSPRGAQKYN